MKNEMLKKLAIVSDIDGCIMDTSTPLRCFDPDPRLDNLYEEQLKFAMRKWKEQGYSFFFNTANTKATMEREFFTPYHWIMEYSDGIFYENGAYGGFYREKEIFLVPLDTAKLMKKIHSLFNDYWTREDFIDESGDFIIGMRPKDHNLFLAKKEALFKLVKERLKSEGIIDQVNVRISCCSVDIIPLNSSKAKAVEWIKAKGFTPIVAGDTMVDVPAFLAAPFGFAPANLNDEAKKRLTIAGKKLASLDGIISPFEENTIWIAKSPNVAGVIEFLQVVLRYLSNC